MLKPESFFKLCNLLVRNRHFNIIILFSGDFKRGRIPAFVNNGITADNFLYFL